MTEPLQLPPPKPSPARRFGSVLSRHKRIHARIVRARKRSRLIDIAFTAIERDSEIGGGILAGALAYRLFLFALPLGFFLVSMLGVLADILNRNAHAIGKNLGLAGLVTQQMESAATSSSNSWVALGSLALLLFVSRDLYRGFAIVHALAWERSAATVHVSYRSLGVFDAAAAGQLTLVTLAGVARQASAVAGVLRLREIRPDDQDEMRQAFDRLSSASRYTRFMSTVKERGPGEAAHVELVEDGIGGADLPRLFPCPVEAAGRDEPRRALRTPVLREKPRPSSLGSIRDQSMRGKTPSPVDFGNLHDTAGLGELDRPDVRRILVERAVRARLVIRRSSGSGCGASVLRRGREHDSETRAGAQP
jgi:hypothetical protein